MWCLKIKIIHNLSIYNLILYSSRWLVEKTNHGGNNITKEENKYKMPSLDNYNKKVDDEVANPDAQQRVNTDNGEVKRK